MALFAEKGFKATRVGDIESAAGLQPRRGALYYHFASKEHLLEEGIRAYSETVATGSAQITELVLPEIGPGDLPLVAPIVSELGRWFLDTLDRQQDLVRVLEHDGHRLGDLAKRVRHDIVDTGADTAAHLLRSAVPRLQDPHANAVMLLNALIGLRRTTWTFGHASLDDSRALATWTGMVLGVIGAAVGQVQR